MYGEQRKRTDLCLSHPTDLINRSRGQILMDLFYLSANVDLQAQVNVRSPAPVVRGILNRILFQVEFGVRLSPSSKSKSAYWQIEADMQEALRSSSKRGRDEDEEDQALARDAAAMRKLRRLSRGKSPSEKIRLLEEELDE